jgi:glycosyltransferase involved in cell wall biosynthesis
MRKRSTRAVGTTHGSTWLLIAPHFDGHHYPYLEHLVDGALTRGLQVIVGTGDDAEQGARTQAALRARFGQRRIQIVTAPLPRGPRQLGLLGLAHGELQRLGFLRALYVEASVLLPIDHVFLPYMDWTLFAIGLVGAPFHGTPYSGITMRQRFHLEASGVIVARERMNAWKGRLFRRLLRDPDLARVYTNDETLAEFFRGSGNPSKVLHLPDPSDPGPMVPRDEARRRLGLRLDGCVVLVYGYLDERKGVRTLLEWVGRSTARAASLLIVGQQAPETAALLSSPSARSLMEAGRLHASNCFVLERDEPLYFGAADIVWLGYDRFEMMSGVLVKAAQYHRAVVFREYGLIAHYAHKHGAPVRAESACAPLLSALPPGLSARTFDERRLTSALPDHSWSHALQLIYG